MQDIVHSILMKASLTRLFWFNTASGAPDPRQIHPRAALAAAEGNNGRLATITDVPLWPKVTPDTRAEKFESMYPVSLFTAPNK